MIYRVLQALFITVAVLAALMLIFLLGRTLWTIIEVVREVL